MADVVNHPPHYTSHPSGVECITVTEHMSFLRGNAVKYLWRAGDKGNELEDLRKARWYLDREIANLEAEEEAPEPAECTCAMTESSFMTCPAHGPSAPEEI